MFDIGWSELVVIGVVALIVIGPKELPALLRTLGQTMTKLRRMASEFQSQLQDAMREAELDELRKQAEKLSSDMTAATSNPLEQATSELQAMIEAPEKSAAAPTSPDASATDTSATQTPAPASSEPPAAAPASAPASEGGRAT